MKNIPKSTILSEKEDKYITFSALDKQDTDELYELLKTYGSYPKNSTIRNKMDYDFSIIHNFELKDIFEIGDTKTDSRSVERYIESNLVRYDKQTRRNYKCFSHSDWKTGETHMNCPYHEDAGCSWNCLMELLNFPKYGIIYAINKEIYNKKYSI